MNVVWRILSYLGRYRGPLVAAYVCLFLAVAAQLTVPQIVGYVIDEGVEPGDNSIILYGSLLIVLVVGVQSIFTYVRSYLFQALAERVSTDIRFQLYEHYMRLPFQFFDTSQSGQLMSRATEDVNSIRRFLMFSLRMAIYSVTMLVVVSILLLVEHLTLALLALAAMPVLGGAAAVRRDVERPAGEPGRHAGRSSLRAGRR